MTMDPAPTAPPKPSEVLDRWNRWTAIINEYSQRSQASKRVDPVEYRTLHARLVEDLRALELAEDRPGFFQAAGEVVEAWPTSTALGHADPASLGMVLERCRLVSRELSGSSRIRIRVRPWWMVLAAIVVAIVLTLLSGRLTWLMQELAGPRLSAARIAISTLTDIQKVGCAAILVSLLGAAIIRQTSNY